MPEAFPESSPESTPSFGMRKIPSSRNWRRLKIPDLYPITVAVTTVVVAVAVEVPVAVAVAVPVAWHWRWRGGGRRATEGHECLSSANPPLHSTNQGLMQPHGLMQAQAAQAAVESTTQAAAQAAAPEAAAVVPV